ncbi:glycosyltransferase [Streptomyces viridiviolaceus]|uniref:Glycosyltransferase n=1 Tax=Streptomyces viridiviolaceus TaxID=68282 RepID=A0ABW2EH58_9ACTN|nr:glycosyltransferase [Streptomyces viridiviolaceus]
MRVLIVTVGTWGDVAPYLGLGLRLQAAGHEVALTTHLRFAEAVLTHGLHHHPLPADPWHEIRSPHGRRLARAATAPVKLGRALRHFQSFLPRLTDGVLEAVRQGADVLLASSLADPLCRPVAEALRVPCLGAYLQPTAPTGAFAPLALSGCRSLGPRGNLLAAHALRSLTSHAFAPAVTRLRRQLDLPLRHRGATGRAPRSKVIYHGFSPVVVPRPRDWPAELQVCGYWWPPRPTGWRPDSRIVDFLRAGPAPVFISFGSFAGAEATELSALVAEALRTAGMRGIVQSGWSGLHVEGDDILTVSEVPHDWILPRTAAVVHHAGAGTTAAGLRAGVPAVPVPGQLDQYFWADRLVAMGSAPTCVPHQRLTAPLLADALRRAVGDPSYRARTGRIADRLATEDGAAPVLAALTRLGP